MRTFILSTFILIAGISNGFSQKRNLTFFIENQTGLDFYGLYVTASDDGEWGEDLLPDHYFENGDNIKVTIPIFKNTICDHDILVTYGESEEDQIIFEEIDFCSLRKLVFYRKGRKIYYEVE
jgi:hypothetical protein